MSDLILAGYIIDIPENSKGESILVGDKPIELRVPVYLKNDTPQKMREKMAKLEGVYTLSRDAEK